MQKFTLCSLNGCGSLVEICLWVNVSVDLDVNCSHEIDNFRLFCGGVIVSDVRGACIDPGVILRTKKVRLSGNICMNSWGLNITKLSRTISEDWLCSIFLPFFFLFTFRVFVFVFVGVRARLPRILLPLLFFLFFIGYLRIAWHRLWQRLLRLFQIGENIRSPAGDCSNILLWFDEGNETQNDGVIGKWRRNF